MPIFSTDRFFRYNNKLKMIEEIVKILSFVLMYNIILLINLKVNNTNMKNFRKELYAFIPTMYYIKANE